MKPHPQLSTFLSPYDPPIKQLTMELREWLTSLVPEANEMIWDNYNAVAMAYGKSMKLSDAFCHISVYEKHVNLGFNRGAELRPSTIQLNGKGKLIRHITMTTMSDHPMDIVEKLIWEALNISEARNPALLEKASEGESIVKSISQKKRRPIR